MFIQTAWTAQTANLVLDKILMFSLKAQNYYPTERVANGTTKNVGLGKFSQDLEVSEAFLISLEVSFLHGLFLLFLNLETFYQRVSGSDFYLGSRRLGESRILPFATPTFGGWGGGG